MKILEPSPEALAKAVAALSKGEVIVYPAETMYGLGVDPFSTEAIERLFHAKGRPDNNPIPVIVANTEQLTAFVSEIDDDAKKLIAKFWPGPLSLVMPKSNSVPDILTAGHDNICVRCPGSTIAREICERFGRGITSTSANASGENPVNSLHDLHLPSISIGIDGGDLQPGPPSTIFDTRSKKVLREGPIAPEAIAACMAE